MKMEEVVTIIAQDHHIKPIRGEDGSSHILNDNHITMGTEGAMTISDTAINCAIYQELITHFARFCCCTHFYF